MAVTDKYYIGRDPGGAAVEDDGQRTARVRARLEVWNSSSMQWERMVQPVAGGSGGSGGLTDAELRATPVDVLVTGQPLSIDDNGGSLTVDSDPLALQLDEADATTTYVGEATPGSTAASAAWRIKRIVDTAGDLAITWADGNAAFDNVWSNRASLSYS